MHHKASPGHDAHRCRWWQRHTWPFSLGLGVLVLCAWHGFVRWQHLPPLILPTPGAVALALLHNLADGSLLPHIWITLSEILLGFAGGSLLGIGLGALVAMSPLAQHVLHPYIIASQAMPKLALAPLFLIWFGLGIIPKVISHARRRALAPV
jgi:NitT/TauT family transport system permease protein